LERESAVDAHAVEPVGMTLERIHQRHRLAVGDTHDEVCAGADVVEQRIRDGRFDQCGHGADRRSAAYRPAARQLRMRQGDAGIAATSRCSTSTSRSM
jgi:hypothetical protein